MHSYVAILVSKKFMINYTCIYVVSQTARATKHIQCKNNEYNLTTNLEDQSPLILRGKPLKLISIQKFRGKNPISTQLYSYKTNKYY